jgi:hypothetical protein
VFDSGVGGLTVLAALRERLPAEAFVYLGDTARLPYGTKTEQTVARYAAQATRCLVDRGVKMVVVRAAVGPVSTARAQDPLLLARACYHLGNRHVPLEIAVDYVRYLHDHVLDGMLVQLGLVVVSENVPFEPEAGAFQTGHGHTHDH